MLRTIWIFAFTVFHTLLCSILSIIFGLFNPYSGLVNNVIRFWAKGILKVAGVRVVVHGKEKIKPGQPYIFISNHQSAFDIPAGVVAIPGTMRFIAKKELFRIPIFAQAMRIVGMIPIDRGNSEEARKTLNQAVQKLQSGVSVLIFPEGTRSENGEIKPFKKGGFVLALRSGLPIMPMVFSGALQIMRKGEKKLRKGTIHIYFLDPVDSTRFTFEQRNQLVKQVRDQIVTQYARLNAHGEISNL